VYQLIRTLDPDIGPLIEVTISASFQTQPDNDLPQSATLKLLIDTGATDTCLRGPIIDALKLFPLAFHKVHSIGPEMVSTMQYLADLEVHMDGGRKKEFFGAEVCRFDSAHSGIDGLLGRDILRQGRFVMDGLKRQFALEF
jgi:hypothetical protein